MFTKRWFCRKLPGAAGTKAVLDQTETETRRRLMSATSSSDYGKKCLDVFKADVSLGENYLFWTLPFGSPETAQLYGAMRTIESGIFAKRLEVLRNERIQGAIVEFGVFSGEGLATIVDKCEELGITRRSTALTALRACPNRQPMTFQTAGTGGSMPARWKEWLSA
jgi:hypothetical protein